MKLFKAVNILNVLIIMVFSTHCLADQTLSATFNPVPVTGKLVNGQVLGYVIFNNVRQEKDAQYFLSGYYVEAGNIVTNSPGDYKLCTTNVPGVGVQYYGGANFDKIRCYGDKSDFYIFDWPKNKWGTLYPINRKTMEFVIYDVSKLTKGGTFTVNSLYGFWQNGTKFQMGPVNISPNVSFTIPPQKSAAIYFPEYPAGNPTIDLPFKIGGSDPQHLYASAKKTIPMCLADDNGINSSQFMLQISSSYQQTGTDTFYLQRQGGSAIEGDQVNFHLSIINPLTNANQTVIAAQPILWNNINSSSVNTVNYNINGKIQPCVLTPLTIKVPSFNYSSKTTGIYSGNIDILFTPTLDD